MEVGTGTTDASMDEWLQVCISRIVDTFFSFLFFFIYEFFIRRHSEIPYFQEIKVMNLSPLNVQGTAYTQSQSSKSKKKK